MKSRFGKWTIDDLTRRLCHALEVAACAIECLAPNGFIDPDQPANNVRPEKVVAETAFLLLAASMAGEDTAVRARIDHVARLLVPHARSDRMRVGTCLEPALALDYGHAHICLNKLGFRDDRFDALLRKSVSAQGSTGRERFPHRVLEQQWIADLWNDREGQSSRRACATAKRSVLGQSLDPLNASREDVYAFTHALMYSRRFSRYSVPLPRPRTVVLAEAEGALARCLDQQDYDLAGELLLAWPLTGKRWSATAVFGFRVLTRVEDTAGFLPTPSTRIERVNALQGVDRSRYLLATAYHTVYVMGLLCAAILQSREAPPTRLPVRKTMRGCVAAILDHANGDAAHRHWQDEFKTLSDVERDALGGFLLDVLLRRKVIACDFAAVRKLLEIGVAFNLTTSSVSSHCAELLERLAIWQWSATDAAIRARDMDDR